MSALACRTPMQWTKGKNAGFSTSAPDKLYFPVDTENGKLTVEAQQGDQNSLLSYTRKLTALRHSAKALDNEGDWKLLNRKGQEYPMVYERTLGDEKYVVVVNPGAKGSLSQHQLCRWQGSFCSFYRQGCI